MKNLRVIDEHGNRQDHETEFVPRIGERIVLEYGSGGDPVRSHYFRVKDVEYHLNNPTHVQVRILIAEELKPEPSPT